MTMENFSDKNPERSALKEQQTTIGLALEDYKEELMVMVEKAVLSHAIRNGAEQYLDDYVKAMTKIQGFRNFLKDLGDYRKHRCDDALFSYTFLNNMNNLTGGQLETKVPTEEDLGSYNKRNNRIYNRIKNLENKLDIPKSSTAFLGILEKTYEPEKITELWVKHFHKTYIKNSVLGLIKWLVSRNYRREIELVALEFLQPMVWKEIRKFKAVWKTEAKVARNSLIESFITGLGLIPPLAKDITLKDCISRIRLLDYLHLIPPEDQKKKENLQRIIIQKEQELAELNSEIEVRQEKSNWLPTKKELETEREPVEPEEIPESIIEKKCDQCQNKEIMEVCIKITDFRGTLTYKNRDFEEYIPDNIGISDSDYIAFSYCLNCGKIQGKFPLKAPPEFGVESVDE